MKVTLNEILRSSSKDVFRLIDIAYASELTAKEIMAEAILVKANLLYKFDESLRPVCGYKSSNLFTSRASHIQITSPEMIIEGYPYAVIPAGKYAKVTDTDFELAHFNTLAKVDPKQNKIIFKHAPLPLGDDIDIIATLTDSAPAFILCHNKRYVLPPLEIPFITPEENTSLTFLPIKHSQPITDKDLWLHRDDIMKIFPALDTENEHGVQQPWMNDKLHALNIACVSYYSKNNSGSTKKFNAEELRNLVLHEIQKVSPDEISNTALEHCITALRMSKRQVKLIPTTEEKNRYHPLTAPSLVKMNEISRILYEENINPNVKAPQRSDYQRAETLATEEGCLPKRAVRSLAPFMIPKAESKSK